MKRTKIIGTIGPASADPKVLEEMIKNGMNVARFNFSHGTHEEHAKLMANARLAAKKAKAPLAIIQDLQGPKIRVQELKHSVSVKTGQKVVIGEDFSLDFDISKSIKPGECILIEDGLIALKVRKITGRKIYCEAENPGEVKSHKGINLPDSQVKFPIMTDKDIKDLRFGLKQDVDFIALSFVRGKQDILNLRKLIKKYNPKDLEEPKIIAKIERREGVRNIDEILREVDAIMIARGDLGVEMSDSEVPVVQKNIIAKCIQAARPVIVATQMLESMSRNPRPTRAEVSDVANAVIDKADAVMLSGETSTGAYPVEVVKEMRRIIEATERSPYAHIRFKYSEEHSTDPFEIRAAAIAESVYDLARKTQAKAIIGTTESGFTARFISHQRPRMPVIILTDRAKIYRQNCLYWGVTPLFVPNMTKLEDIEDLLEHFIEETKVMKLVKKNDRVVLVAGNPLGQRMNLVEVVTVS
jgi:pyruvate kinase